MFTIFFYFLLNHLWKCKKPDDKKQKKKVKRTSKFRQVYVKLIAVRKQNVSKPVTLNELKSSSLPYNEHSINRGKSVCMGESWPRSCVQTSLHSVCIHDLGQDSPIQTDLPRLIRAKYQHMWKETITWHQVSKAPETFRARKAIL